MLCSGIGDVIWVDIFLVSFNITAADILSNIQIHPLVDVPELGGNSWVIVTVTYSHVFFFLLQCLSLISASFLTCSLWQCSRKARFHWHLTERCVKNGNDNDGLVASEIVKEICAQCVWIITVMWGCYIEQDPLLKSVWEIIISIITVTWTLFHAFSPSKFKETNAKINCVNVRVTEG